jgi:MoaA/NifB/PqqE/SkfB family radical SAM enzyme
VDKTIQAVSATLRQSALQLLAVELSLDGMAEFHDGFRVAKGSFDRAMQTYDALAALQASDPRLRIHAISTATNVNLEEIRKLTTFLFDRCPRMDHHNLALIRGDRKNPALTTPDLGAYAQLYRYMQRLWQGREAGRYGAIVEPLLQWAKIETLERQTQIVPCRAGILTAVVAANGDVSVCELHEPLGNLRQQSFEEIWFSDRASALRESVAAKQCHCTTEVFLWPSIVYQPAHLARAMVSAKVWRRVPSLDPAEKVSLAASTAEPPGDPVA